MNISSVSFRGRFTVPYNKVNEKVKYFHPSVLKIVKETQSHAIVSPDKVVINANKTKDDFIRTALNKLGVQFKEEAK